jgi:hypothetical protein
MAITRIAQVDVGAGGAASIDFTSIPQTYTDLQLVISAYTTTTGNNLNLKINNDSTLANYLGRQLYGDGSSVSSTTRDIFIGIIGSAYTTANAFSNISVYIPNYSGAASKSYSIDSVNENNASGAIQSLMASRWNGTAAITTLTLTLNSANFAEYSSATLYGISNAGATGATVS